MVYHETRKQNGKIKNYIIHNRRESGKWKKKSKFIGYDKISKKEFEKEKRKFEKELIINKKYEYLNKQEVEKIENLKEIYTENINSMKKEEFLQFKKSFNTELTYDSNAIEGNTLSLQETSLIVNEGIAPKGKEIREISEAQNHSNAIKYLEQYKGEFTEELILKLHSIILKNISDRFAGKYRTRDIRVAGSNFKFSSHEKIPQLINNLVYWYNKNKNKYHQFELAAIISGKFVTIHPFIEGNGRVSRLIMNFLLDKKEYPWINIYRKQREEYLNAIRKVNDKKYKNFISFLIKTLEENMEELEII